MSQRLSRRCLSLYNDIRGMNDDINEGPMNFVLNYVPSRGAKVRQRFFLFVVYP